MIKQENQSLPRIKKSQKVISSLPPQKSNLILPFTQLSALYPQFQICLKSSYYPYNHKYEDFGWGCAWRATQTVLAAFDVHYDLKELIDKYQHKDKLLELYFKIDKRQTYVEQIRKEKWAPSQNQNCWAEPFISKLICIDHNLLSELFLVNGYPHAYAPQFVFQKVLNFQNFWLFIKTHLLYSPIMIDDGYLALTIVAYHQGIEQQKHIIVADPHIISNNSGKNKYSGIYKVVLNKEGKQLSNNVAKQDYKLYPFYSFDKIQFCEKKWMGMAVIKSDQIFSQVKQQFQ